MDRSAGRDEIVVTDRRALQGTCQSYQDWQSRRQTSRESSGFGSIPDPLQGGPDGTSKTLEWQKTKWILHEAVVCVA